MMGFFAEFERSMIRERVNAGLRRAKAAGKTLGRRKLEDERDAERRAVAEAVRAISGKAASEFANSRQFTASASAPS